MALWADTSAPDIMAQERTGARVSLTRPVLTCPVNSKRPATQATTDPGGGSWVFFGWVCASPDSKLAPCSKKNVPEN